MTQQPFSRPGAVDLSSLAAPPAGAGGGPAGGAASGGTGGGVAGSSYAVQADEQNFQGLIEASVTAPVLLVFYSRTQAPASGQLADDLVTLSAELEGRVLVGLVDIDAAPSIAQAMRVPSIPLVVAVLDGRPAPLLQDAVPLEQLREVLAQVLQQLTTQGVSGRHQPQHAGPAEPAEGDVDGEPPLDPRYAPAQEALEAGDVDRAVAEYQKLVQANPADTEAAAGLAMAGVLQRTAGVDLNAAREDAAARPDDVDAQTLVADLDLVGGHVEDAFARLVELVRRTTEKDRDRAREHLVALFGAVGNDDPRVVRGRQALASALF